MLIFLYGKYLYFEKYCCVIFAKILSYKIIIFFIIEQKTSAFNSSFPKDAIKDWVNNNTFHKNAVKSYSKII